MSTTDSRPLTTELIEYVDDRTIFEAYAAFQQEERESVPCVIVAHNWSGQNRSAREVTERLGGLGYLGFALDVYGKGVRGSETGDNSALMNPLLADRLLLRRRLLAGLRAAREHPRVDRDRVAILGYCFGGLCALDLARAAPQGLRAAVSFHGVLKPPDVGQQPPIETSILILHGWEDPVAPPPDVLAIAKELTDAGADWQLHAYGHARHAFTFRGANFPERGIVYSAAADRRSWAAMTAFLSEVFA